MSTKLNVPVIFITILILTIITLTGCDPFTYPTGIWYCEDLQITVDFKDGTSNFTAEIFIDGEIKNVNFAIASGGIASIYFLKENDIYIDGETDLYLGNLSWKNKYTMIFSERNIKTGEYTGNKYVFVKLSDETTIKE